MTKRKITITVAGQPGVGKSSVMTLIEWALREAGLAATEVTQVSCMGEAQTTKVVAQRNFPGDHPDGTYEVEIRELMTGPARTDIDWYGDPTHDTYYARVRALQDRLPQDPATPQSVTQALYLLYTAHDEHVDKSAVSVCQNVMAEFMATITESPPEEDCQGQDVGPLQ